MRTLMICVTVACSMVVVSDESLRQPEVGYADTSETSPPPMLAYTYLTVLGLYLFFAFRARSGRRSGQIGTPITTVLVFLMMAPYCWLGFVDAYDVFGPEGEEFGPALSVLTMGALAAAVVVPVLIYLPASNTYFRQVRASSLPPPPSAAGSR